MSKKLIAIPFGTDGYGGDSLFYPGGGSQITGVDEKATFDELFIKWRNTDIFDDDTENQLAGFWLVDQRGLDIIEAVWPEDGCGNDGHTYHCNRSAKRVAKKIAISTVYRLGYDESLFAASTNEADR